MSNIKVTLNKNPLINNPAVGMFKGRKEMVDSVKWVNKIRSKKYRKRYL